MAGILRIPPSARRFLVGAFALYVFGLLGFLGSSHGHADGDARPGAHQDCPLCQMVQQPFAAPDPVLCPETPAGPAALVESVWAPILASRHRPFSSRAPPSV